MEDNDFEIFGPSQHGRPGDMDEVFDLIRHEVEEHNLSLEAAIDCFIDIVRPGQSERSHDVRPMFVGAMYAYGHGPLARQITVLYLTTMPWGVGFSISTAEDFNFNQLSKNEQTAIMNSLCMVMRAGGLNADIDEHNHITLTDDDGTPSRVDIDAVVSQFREEIEQELGPDDPMRRWLP